MQKDVYTLMLDIEQIKGIRRLIQDGMSLDEVKDEIDNLLDEYLDILLGAKVKI